MHGEGEKWEQKEKDGRRGGVGYEGLFKGQSSLEAQPAVVIGGEFPVIVGEEGLCTDGLGEVSGHSRLSRFFVVVFICPFRNQFLVPVIWNQFHFFLLTYQCLVSDGSDNTWLPGAQPPPLHSTGWSVLDAITHEAS